MIEHLELLEEYFTKKVPITENVNWGRPDELLEVLDEGTFASEQRGGYTGVTIDYIKKYVLTKKDFSNSQIFFMLGILFQKNIIHFIYCNNINKVVVEKRINQNGYQDYNTQFQRNISTIGIFND